MPSGRGDWGKGRTVRPSSTKASAVVLSTSAVTLQPKWFQLFHPLRDVDVVSTGNSSWY